MGKLGRALEHGGPPDLPNGGREDLRFFQEEEARRTARRNQQFAEEHLRQERRRNWRVQAQAPAAPPLTDMEYQIIEALRIGERLLLWKLVARLRLPETTDAERRETYGKVRPALDSLRARGTVTLDADRAWGLSAPVVGAAYLPPED